MTSTPIIGITLGDPAGIGPEVTVKALPSRIAVGDSRPIVLGDARVVRDAAARWLEGWSLRVIADPAESDPAPGRIDVLDLRNCDPARVAVGTVDAYTGEAAYGTVVRATEPGARRPHRRHRDRAAEQGGDAAGRPQVRRPHGSAGPPLRGHELLHAAGLAAAARAPRLDAPLAARGRAAGHARARTGGDPGGARPYAAVGHRRAADRGLRAQPARRRAPAVRRRGRGAASGRRAKTRRRRASTPTARCPPTPPSGRPTRANGTSWS